MKKIRFFACLMAMFVGLSFGFTSCGDEEDGNDNGGSKEYVDTDVISSGQAFYTNLETAVQGDAVAIASVVTTAAQYQKFKNDKEYTTNFLAGVVMQKYGVADVAVAKSEEYMGKVSALKAVLDEGITAENVSNALVSLASFIASK